MAMDTMMRLLARSPDYGRINELERELGLPLTARPPVAAVHELDAVIRETAQWLLTGRGLPELADSRVAQAGRRVVLGLLAFAGLWFCLMMAGVVPWSS